jgi:hypothetical protein
VMEDFDFYFDDEYLRSRQDSLALGSISPLVLPLANTVQDVYLEDAAHWEALWQLEEDVVQTEPSYSSRYRQASEISVFDEDLVIVNLMDNYGMRISFSLFLLFIFLSIS